MKSARSASSHMTTALRLPQLRPDQQRIIQRTATADVTVVACGRRWGKTVMAGVYAVAAMAYGGHVAWVAPTYRNARAAWRFAEMHVGGVGRVFRAERMIELRAGRLSVYSADNDAAMRGEAFDLVIVDEAALVREETYTDALLPTLADRGGRMLLISTPRGKNWFWREWLRGRSGESGYAAFQAPTSANPNPKIQRAAALARERVSDRSYRQEWLAEFIDDSGDVFRNVRALATAPDGQTPDPEHVYVFGVDWGRSNDYTVAVALDATDRRVVAVQRMRNAPYAVQLQRIRVMYDYWRPQIIVAERNAMGDPLVEQLSREGLPIRPFRTDNASKSVVIDALALALERGDLALLPYEPLLAELEAYEARPLPSGLYAYSAPSGMHDDCVIALALAWSAVGVGRNSAIGAFQ